MSVDTKTLSWIITLELLHGGVRERTLQLYEQAKKREKNEEEA